MKLKLIGRISIIISLASLAGVFEVSAATYPFTANLSFGMTGPSVRELQRVLNSDTATIVSSTGPGAPGSESSYFGAKTRDAVIRFQRKHGISPAVGFVGPITRAKLNTLGASVAIPSNTPPAPTSAASHNEVCNTALIGSDGYDERNMIDRATCERLNELYRNGKAAGNAGDLYVNRDDLHVNFCVGWTPDPECPLKNRLFFQHDWKISGGGRASVPESKITLGQASYSGSVSGGIKHSIPFERYMTQSGADELYKQYIKSNLYFYPSLYEDSFEASIYDVSLLSDPRGIDEKTMNTANTPYVVGTKQICDCGAGSLRIHDASGSELALIELGFAGLAAFKPEVKEKLRQGIVVDGEKAEMVMPTLQALIRYSHRSVHSESDYLSGAAHGGAYTAHYLKNGEIVPAYSASELVDSASSLSVSDVPPLVRLKAISETWSESEKTFTTPGAISRSVAANSGSREMTISAEGSANLDGTTGNLTYRFVVLSGSGVTITEDALRKGRAKIEFTPGSSTGRADIGIFVKKSGGAYYSVPGMVSLYTR